MKIFHLPDLGEGLTEAEIREWQVKVGDEIAVDDRLVTMETAKAVVDVPSPYTGRIVALHGKVNDIIKTGAPLVTFECRDDETKDSSASVVGKLEESAHRWEETPFVASVTQPTTKPTTVKAQPAARLLATQMEVDLHLVTPTGPQGLITTADVKQFLQEQANSPFNKMKALTGKKEALHGVRRHMAEIMVQSHKEIVPATIIDDADITAWPAESDVTAQLLTAIAQAVLIEPALNAWFDGKALERKLFSAVHIGLALDTAEGLFVPVVKNVEIKSKTELRKEVNHFKEATKTRSLLATEMQGASIILSNFGTLAGRYATPIIVPPMVAIIGCGRSYEAACFREGKVVAGRLLPLSLTFDHRAVTGAEASRFLRAIITNLQ